MDIDDTLKLDDVSHLSSIPIQNDYNDYNTPRSIRYDDSKNLEYDISDSNSQKNRLLADNGQLDSPGSPTHIAVVRSRSSYSYHNMGDLLTIPNLLNGRTRQFSSSPIVNTSLSRVALTNNSAETSDAVSSPVIVSSENHNNNTKKEEEGFLQEIQSYGFIGFWSHTLTKSYFLMYLLWRGFEDLFFFRMEAHHYRIEYQTLYSSARKAHAYRIYNTFLSRNSPMYILKRATAKEMPILKAIQIVKANTDKHNATLFDDVAFFVMQWLEDIFNGFHDSNTEFDTHNKAYMLSRDIEAPSFQTSVFYQALKNDLHGARTVSTKQYSRLSERITDLPPYIYENNEVLERTILTLETFGIEFEKSRSNTYASLTRKNSFRQPTPSGRTRTMTPIEATRRKDSDSLDLNGLSPLKDWKKGSSTALSLSLANTENNHIWVQNVAKDKNFCEYCCKAFSNNLEDNNTAYQCESCGFLCHRNCRSSTNVSCMKNMLDGVDDKNELNSEKLRKLEDKIQAIQKEIDIEEKIKLGLDNFVAAKKKLGKKISPTKKTGQNTQEIESQLERSKKNLDILREQQQKCKLQRAALLSAAQQLHDIQDEDTNEEIAGESNNEVVRIISMDNAMKAQTTKTFVISPNTTVKQLIRLALDKFLLPGAEEDYALSYLSEIGEVPMRLEDMPNKLGIDLMSTPLKLRVLNPIGTSGGLSKEEEKQLRKQREVLMEICETEISYTEDLSNILTLFLDPMTKADIITPAVQSEIFSNIISLSSLHDRIVQEIEDKKMDKQGQYLNVHETVEIYKNHISRFSAYEEYCGNQNNARRKLNKMKNDQTFLRFLQKCESNPKLHKLSLSDLLVKPMHRITRYPIFFKRLLTHVNKDSADYVAINDLINNIETMAVNVNESVRQHESSYRIRYIDDNLDFGNVVERFRIANGRRELVSEKQFTYMKKNSSAIVEVTVLFFSDLVLMVKSKKAESFVLFKPPIPLESIVLLDKPDTVELKNAFQIVHIGSEIHTLVTNTAYDKNTWLQEAETIRAQFCAIHHQFEVNSMRDMATWFSHLALQEEGTTFSESPELDLPFSPSTLSSSPISARRRFTSSPIKSDRFNDPRQRQQSDNLDFRRSNRDSAILSSSASHNSNNSTLDKKGSSWLLFSPG